MTEDGHPGGGPRGVGLRPALRDEARRAYPRGPRAVRLVVLVVAALILASVALAASFVWPLRADDVVATARSLRIVADAPFAPVVALAAFVVAVSCGLPATLLTGVTMLLFGIAEGALIAFLAVLGGGSLVYAVGRLAARPLVDRWLARRSDRWFTRLRDELTNRGFVTVALLRLTPIPYAMANLALGASRIRFRDFLAGTALGILPSFAIVAALTSGLDHWMLASDGAHGSIGSAVGAIGLVAVAVSAFFYHRRRRAADVAPTPPLQDQ